MKRGSCEERALSAWVGGLPGWVLALARACDQGSQTRTAAVLDVPQSYVSWALRAERREYHERVETAVRALLMGEAADCPVLGEIGLDRCREHRRRTGRALGPIEKALREACPRCPFNPEGGRNAPEEEADHG